MLVYLRSLIIATIATIAHLLLWAFFHYSMLPSPPALRPPLRVKIITNTTHSNNKKPKETKVLAGKDHATKKQTAPLSSKPSKKESQKASKNLPSTKTIIANPAANNKDLSYAEFLQHSAKAMAGVDWQGESGDVIDINTSSYRYVGYFTAIRNSISLAWHYPRRAAVEGQQGLVKLDFTVNAQGDASAIQIIKSSGYHLLDEAIISAIRSASPFQPLPASIGKEKIRIRGSFWYVLND